MQFIKLYDQRLGRPVTRLTGDLKAFTERHSFDGTAKLAAKDI